MLDEKQFNTILDGIETNIPSNCEAYDRKKKLSTTYTGVPGAVTFQLSDYEAYRNDIEFVNSFTEQVLVDERRYFESKYSPVVYQYLLAQRRAYNKQASKMTNAKMCKTYIDNNQKLTTALNKVTPCTTPANTKASGAFSKYLMSQNPIERPDTTFKKIEYRSEAHEWLTTINLWMTILYFVLLALMIGLLVVSDKLFLRDRFMLYLFLVVLPFAFPYFFDLLKMLYFYIVPPEPSHGPKSSFVEITPDIVSFDI
jgi:hypothetical protein